MFQKVVCFVFLVMISLLFGAKGELDFKKITGSNNSDEDPLLRNLFMHMVLNMEEMSLELKQLRESCVKKDEVQKIVENVTQSPLVRNEGNDKSGYPLLNNQYRVENIPTSTEIPVVPSVNMSSMDTMMKLLVRRTCYDWLQSGFTTSGLYSIDPDGQGIGEPPFSAYCDMLTGFTFVRHDKEGQLDASACSGFSCHKNKISYSTSIKQIQALIHLSQSCQQFVKLDCYESPLQVGNTALAWWVGGDRERHYDWAGELYREHTCTCGYTRACVNPIKTCNCDAAIPNVWVSDSGYVTNSTALPIEEVSFGTEESGKPLQVKYIIGPLRCHGSKSISYPASCLDLFLQGFKHSGWYTLGRPDSLRFSFCNMDALHSEHGSVSSSHLEPVQSPDIDLGDFLLTTLQSMGFNLSITEEVDHTQKSYKSLESKLLALDHKVNLLNGTISSYRSFTNLTTTEHNDKINTLENIVADIKNKVLQHSIAVDQVQHNITHLNSERTNYTTKVAFHAMKKSSYQSASDVMEYETVNFNLGEGYDVSTGKFTAPVAGIYYFGAYGRKYDSNNVYFRIKKNNINAALARIRENIHSDQSVGVAAMLDLKTGDEVYVELDSGRLRGASDGGTSFMAYLLYET